MVKNILKDTVKLTGVGLHTGKDVQVIIHPEEVGFGIRFKRTDIAENPIFSADVSSVFSTQRGTTLKVGNHTLATVEHFLSAFYSLNIQDLLIEVDGPELPILDGSASIIINALKNAGLHSVEDTKDYIIIEETFEFKDEETGAEYFIFPNQNFELSCVLDFDNSFFPTQYAELQEFSNFEREIAPCRTFVFLSEVEQLFDLGLIKGGNIDNAIVIVDKEMSEENKLSLSKKIGKPNVQVTKQGILNTLDLKFNNEPARHKILDIIGDLSLVGRPIKAKIIAKKPGHTSNVKLAAILKTKYLEQKKLKGRPVYDPNIEPVMDTEAIKKLLPHRYPFLMVDKVIEIGENHIVGVKNITVNEEFFQGHFPGNPIFPGVLQMEALAQVGGLLALNMVDDGQGSQWDTYFLKMDNVKFKSKVVPGDTLILKMELMDPMRRGIVRMLGTAYVGNKIVSEGELTAQIIKR